MILAMGTNLVTRITLTMNPGYPFPHDQSRWRPTDEVLAAHPCNRAPGHARSARAASRLPRILSAASITAWSHRQRRLCVSGKRNRQDHRHRVRDPALS